MEYLHGGEVIFRVRGELVRHRRELRLYALCRSGAGAWLTRIAPFDELFFDNGLVRGLTGLSSSLVYEAQAARSSAA